MASPTSDGNDEDYYNCETDSEDLSEDSPDEYDSDYDPEKRLRTVTLVVLPVQTLYQ